MSVCNCGMSCDRWLCTVRDTGVLGLLLGLHWFTWFLSVFLDICSFKVFIFITLWGILKGWKCLFNLIQ